MSLIKLSQDELDEIKTSYLELVNECESNKDIINLEIEYQLSLYTKVIYDVSLTPEEVMKIRKILKQNH